MRDAARLAFLLALFLAFPCSRSLAQDSQEATGSITGRVMLGDKPAPGVTVVAVPEPIQGRSKPIRTRTDEDGRYRFSDIPASRYQVSVSAPALVAASEASKSVSVGDGLTVEGIDFALNSGGVITGRVTDATGRPVIGEIVSLKPVDGTPHGYDSLYAFYSFSRYLTDDRGVYRLFGLPPGRYVVSVGGQSMLRSIMPTLNRENNTVTYHPGVTEESRATVIEVKAGGEASGIDIRIGLPEKSYHASGRVVDAQTGKPVPGVMVIYQKKENKEGEGSDGDLGGFSPSNARGEFRFDNLLPGQYMATAHFVEESDYYSEHTPFEVKHQDQTGLEIKAHRGATISGVAVVENSTDPEILSRLQHMGVAANTSAGEMQNFELDRGKIAADGSFLIRGVRPGKARIHAGDYTGEGALRLMRVERNGVAQPDGIEVKAGEQVTGVRLVLAYGAGVVRGRVILTGGRLPAKTRLEVVVRRVGDEKNVSEYAGVDQNGQFVVKNLAPGEYEVEVKARSETTDDDDDDAEQSPSVKQFVTVTNETPAEVIITLDLKTKGRD